jgi:hypothetical protein
VVKKRQKTEKNTSSAARATLCWIICCAAVGAVRIGVNPLRQGEQNMASFRFKPTVALVVAGSMLVSSTGAVAATSSVSAQRVDPWAALSVMTQSAPAAALCGSAGTTAAQPAGGCVLPAVDAPPPVAQTAPPAPTPVPPVEPAGGGLGISPLWLALGAIAIGVAAYFLLRNKHHHATSPD